MWHPVINSIKDLDGRGLYRQAMDAVKGNRADLLASCPMGLLLTAMFKHRREDWAAEKGEWHRT